MSERERWIVYPLLFLALGAALRDKIIKSTETQRITCQGLHVVDNQKRTLLLLGAERFPELRPGAKDYLAVDLVKAIRVDSKNLQADTIQGQKEIRGDRILANQFGGPRDRVTTLVANNVIAKNYTVIDPQGKHITVNGQSAGAFIEVVARIQDFVSNLQRGIWNAQRQQQPAPEGAEPPTQPSAESPPAEPETAEAESSEEN